MRRYRVTREPWPVLERLCTAIGEPLWVVLVMALCAGPR